ncbi:MAG: hypothetical protein WB609_04185 [Candidatus Cybelea sp.]
MLGRNGDGTAVDFNAIAVTNDRSKYARDRTVDTDASRRNELISPPPRGDSRLREISIEANPRASLSLRKY